MSDDIPPEQPDAPAQKPVQSAPLLAGEEMVIADQSDNNPEPAEPTPHAD